MTQRVWYYYIDANGDLWHEGALIDDPQVLQLFMKGLEQLPDGRTFRVFCQGEECRVTAEDVPFVIRRVLISPRKIDLVLPGNVMEPLDPSTLFVGDKNVLYCRIRGGKWTARFNRSSYLDMTKEISFDPVAKEYYLTINKKRYPIQGVKELPQ